jgi:hypothetical protein
MDFALQNLRSLSEEEFCFELITKQIVYKQSLDYWFPLNATTNYTYNHIH